MKRLMYSIVFFILFVSMTVFAQDDETLVLKTVIPEDYGITVPDVIKLDRFVLALREDTNSLSLIEKNYLDTGFSDDGENTISIVLLYYGNLEKPYDVLISADTGNGFVYGGKSFEGSHMFPVDVLFERPDDLVEGIEVDVLDNDFVHVVVPPMGPLRGTEIVDLSFYWDAGRNMFPGKYIAEIRLQLEVN